MGIRIDIICDGCGEAEVGSVIKTEELQLSRSRRTVEFEEGLHVPGGWEIGKDGLGDLLYCAECWGKRAGIETEAERLRSEVSRLTRENVEMVKIKADHEALRRAAAAVIGSPAELIRLFDERNIPKPPDG